MQHTTRTLVRTFTLLLLGEWSNCCERCRCRYPCRVRCGTRRIWGGKAWRVVQAAILVLPFVDSQAQWETCFAVSFKQPQIAYRALSLLVVGNHAVRSKVSAPSLSQDTISDEYHYHYCHCCCETRYEFTKSRLAKMYAPRNLSVVDKEHWNWDVRRRVKIYGIYAPAFLGGLTVMSTYLVVKYFHTHWRV